MIIPDNRIIYVYCYEKNPMICLDIITILIVAHTLYKEKKLNELLSQYFSLPFTQESF